MDSVGRRSVKTYDFTERLGWSQFVAENNTCLRAILRSRIPRCIDVVRAGPDEDRCGTDYWAIRDGDLRSLSIDLKARADDPIVSWGQDDVALEVWSDIGRKPGWTRDTEKATDYILWLWEPTNRFLLVPFHPHCETFRRYWQQWASEYKCSIQTSNGWQSQCVFVPRLVLLGKLQDWMNGQWQDTTW